MNGIFNPYLFLGAAITATGAGLCMLLNVDTATSKWVGYQIVAGMGIGSCFSVPIIVSQRVVKVSEMSSATAIILCKQPTHISASLHGVALCIAKSDC